MDTAHLQERLNAAHLQERLKVARQQNTAEPLDFAHLPEVEISRRDETPIVQKEKPREESILERPEFAGYGSPIRVVSTEMLTESETEYNVSVKTFAFHDHVVFQFFIRNTIEGQVMTHVTVKLQLKEGDESVWKVDSIIPADSIAWDEEKSCYVSLGFDEASGIPEASFGTTVLFEAKDVEEDEMSQLDTIEGYKEEYPVNDLVVSFVNFIERPILHDFRTTWNETGNEMVEKVTLPFEDVETAVKNIVEVLGLHVFEGSDRVLMGVRKWRGIEI